MIRQPESGSALKKKRRRRRRMLRLLFPLCLAIVILFLAVLLTSFLLHRPKTPGEEESSAPVGTTTTTSASTTTLSTTTGSSLQTGQTGSGGIDYSVAEDPCFDNVAFIGDSRTEGLQLYTGVPNATFYATKGLMVDTFFTKEFVRQGDKKITAPQDMETKKFRKVYIMLGINELGWAYESVFIQKYGELVDKVKSLQPDATIYVQSILPVTQKKSASDKIFNNERINLYNDLIQQMCAEKGVTYLNVAESVGLDNGALPEGSATDGIHLNREYCYKWLNYLRDHTA